MNRCYRDMVNGVTTTQVGNGRIYALRQIVDVFVIAEIERRVEELEAAGAS